MSIREIIFVFFWCNWMAIAVLGFLFLLNSYSDLTIVNN